MGSRGRVVLATCARYPTGDEDAALLDAALTGLGIDAGWAAWTAWTAEPPSSDELVVLRSTWDYPPQRDRFLDWVEALPRVVNPAPMVRWNSDKIYLNQLAAEGIPVVPTEWTPPGADYRHPRDVEVVIKPSVGCGSQGAGRFTPDRAQQAADHVATLHADGRTAMTQPYLTGVDSAGETALVYLDGRFSHAARKGSMLPVDVVHPVHGWSLFVPEVIGARTATVAERSVGDAAVAAVQARFGETPLYARVDLLPGPDGPLVGELELVEPSLFLDQAPGAADVLALAIAARL